MTDTESDPAIEESAEQILNELREINKKLRNMEHELQVVDDNYHSFRERSVQALLSTVCEDMSYFLDDQYDLHWELEELLSEDRDDD